MLFIINEVVLFAKVYKKLPKKETIGIKRYISSFSKGFLLFASIVYSMNYFVNGAIDRFFMLQPSIVLENMELWRMFTFALSPGTLQGIVLFAITFYFFAPRLEENFNKLLFAGILILIIFMQGTLSTMIFWKQSIEIKGMEGVSFFVLTLFAAFNANKKIVIWRFPSVRSYVFVFMIALGWGFLTAIHTLIAGHHIILTAVSSAMIGLTSGLFVFLQMKLVRNFKPSIPNDDFVAPEIPKPEELRMALIKEKERKDSIDRYNDGPYYDNDYSIPLTEENLNLILDKISVYGKESLTVAEEKFLEDYAKHL